MHAYTVTTFQSAIYDSFFLNISCVASVWSIRLKFNKEKLNRNIRHLNMCDDSFHRSNQ